jgi:hypothetical protein
VASGRADQGVIARQRGDQTAARAYFDEALARFVELDHRRGIARVLECLALLAAEGEEPARGLKLAAAASALRGRVGGVISGELERAVARMRQALGVEAARKAWQAGEALSVAEAVELAHRA